MKEFELISFHLSQPSYDRHDNPSFSDWEFYDVMLFQEFQSRSSSPRSSPESSILPDDKNVEIETEIASLPRTPGKDVNLNEYGPQSPSPGSDTHVNLNNCRPPSPVPDINLNDYRRRSSSSGSDVNLNDYGCRSPGSDIYLNDYGRRSLGEWSNLHDFVEGNSDRSSNFNKYDDPLAGNNHPRCSFYKNDRILPPPPSSPSPEAPDISRRPPSRLFGKMRTNRKPCRRLEMPDPEDWSEEIALHIPDTELVPDSENEEVFDWQENKNNSLGERCISERQEQNSEYEERSSRGGKREGPVARRGGGKRKISAKQGRGGNNKGPAKRKECGNQNKNDTTPPKRGRGRPRQAK